MTPREDLWQQLFEQVPEPAFITDANGCLLITNAAAARLLESRECPLDGRPVAEFVVERDRPRIRELLARMQTSRRAVLETELDLRHARGRPLSTATTLVGLRGEESRLRAIGWLLRRLGQPRPMTERLQRTRQEASDLRLALDQSAGLVGFDREGRVEEVNERCCRFLGMSREEIVGCSLEELGLGPDLQGRLPDIRRALVRGDVWGGEVRATPRTGKGPLWLHCTVVALLDAGGRPGHYLAMLQDVTERHIATERLLEQEGLARLGAMAAVVAHEVRNPLAAARGALDVIGPRVTSPGDRRVLADVSERLSRLNDLVGDILLYARPRPVTRAHRELGEMVEGAAREFAADPLSRHVDLVIARHDEPISVQVDAAAIQRVLLNLMRNAAQAMDGRGRIDIAVDCDSESCRVRIGDEGPGIPEAQREKVFEPFFTTKHKGSGLGLATARRTVELHGGRLELASRPEGGTEAIVELPRHGSAAAEA